MKKIIIVFICFILCGCANANDVTKKLDDIFSSQSNEKIRVNNYTDYIEYYLPSDVNEISCEDISYLFDIDDNKIIMNINISNILNKDYYKKTTLVDEGFFDKDKLIYTHAGEYKNNIGSNIRYFINAYQYNEDSLLYFVSDNVNFYGYCANDKVALLAGKILQIAKSANVHEDKILADFSTADVIDYQRVTINLFEKTLPKDGPVDEFIIDKNNQVSE